MENKCLYCKEKITHIIRIEDTYNNSIVKEFVCNKHLQIQKEAIESKQKIHDYYSLEIKYFTIQQYNQYLLNEFNMYFFKFSIKHRELLNEQIGKLNYFINEIKELKQLLET